MTLKAEADAAAGVLRAERAQRARKREDGSPVARRTRAVLL